MSFLVIGLNPAFQKTLCFPSITYDTVNRTGTHRLDIGGKGTNVCRVLGQLGERAVYLTQLGGKFRPLFLEYCAQDGIEAAWVESGSSIRFCYTLINGEDETVTELVEEAEPVGPGTEERILEASRHLIPACETLIISGSRAAGFSEALIPLLAKGAKEAGRKLILDIRGADLLNSLPYKPDLIKPNLFEFAATFAPDTIRRNALAGDEGFIKRRIREACREIWDKYHSGIILTRGARRIWFYEGGDLEECTVESIKPVNTTGSGDAFTAGLAAAFSRGDSMKDAIALGARCGRLNAGLLKVGTIE
jgi:1-phosphofructokinase/tagatose 6-phosphate kinase